VNSYPPESAASEHPPVGPAPEEVDTRPRAVLTEGPIAKTLLLFALPTLASSVLQSFNALIGGDAERAERLAREQLERGPDVASAHVALAYALGQQGRFDRAVPHAERAVAMMPDRTSRTLLAWVLIAGDIDIDRGLELAVKAVDTPDTYFEAAKEMTCMALAEHCLGVAYLKQGRYQEAAEVLTEASRLRPGQRLIREQLQQANELALQSGS